MLVTIEMLGDWMARAGATAIWPVVAGAMGWGSVAQIRGQPHTSRLRFARSLTDWRLPGREGSPGLRRRNAPARRAGSGAVCPPRYRGSTPFLTEVRPHQSSGEPQLALLSHPGKRLQRRQGGVRGYH